MKLDSGLVRTLAQKHNGKLGVNANDEIQCVGFRSNAHKQAFYSDLIQGEKEGISKLVNSLDRMVDVIYEVLFYYGIDDDRLLAIAKVLDSLEDEYEAKN